MQLFLRFVVIPTIVLGAFTPDVGDTRILEPYLTAAETECFRRKQERDVGRGDAVQRLHRLYEESSSGNRDSVTLALRRLDGDTRAELGGHLDMALLYALGGNDPGIIEVLLEEGANIDFLTCYDRDTPLIRASSGGYLDAAAALVAAGADRDIKDRYGDSAMIAAAERGHTGIVQMLLDAGANADTRSRGGRTALIFAVQEGHVGVVRALVNAGADMTARRYDIMHPSFGGQTALDIATATFAANGERLDQFFLEALRGGAPTAYEERSLAAYLAYQSIVRILEDAGASRN